MLCKHQKLKFRFYLQTTILDYSEEQFIIDFIKSLLSVAPGRQRLLPTKTLLGNIHLIKCLKN